MKDCSSYYDKLLSLDIYEAITMGNYLLNYKIYAFSIL